MDAYKRMYLRMMSQFLREGFDPGALGARIEQLANLIRPHVQADPNKPYTNAQFETAISASATAASAIVPFIRNRHAFLRSYLDAQAAATDIRLDELVTVNAGALRDEAGEADPWVKLYNPGPGPATIGGIYLTDDPAEPTKWAVPARRLADGEHLLVWLDGQASQGETHASFRAPAAGGTLYLYSTAVGLHAPLDRVTYGELTAGQSFRRVGLLGNQWVIASE